MTPVSFIAMIGSAMLFVSCAGPSFERAWQQAVAAVPEDGKDPIVGPWEGTWETPGDGHSGKLRCLVSPTAADDRYAFRYHATWGKFFSGGYRAEFDVQPTDAGYTVVGSKDLGMFGEFSHQGLIEGDTFYSTFESGSSKGNFKLFRP